MRWVKRSLPAKCQDTKTQQGASTHSVLTMDQHLVVGFQAFMNPFNLALQFTWQVSAYDTHKFSIMWGFKL